MKGMKLKKSVTLSSDESNVSAWSKMTCISVNKKKRNIRRWKRRNMKAMEEGAEERMKTMSKISANRREYLGEICADEERKYQRRPTISVYEERLISTVKGKERK